MIELLLVAGIIFLIGLFGFFLGQNTERKAWNKLIDKGVIPKP